MSCTTEEKLLRAEQRISGLEEERKALVRDKNELYFQAVDAEKMLAERERDLEALRHRLDSSEKVTKVLINEKNASIFQQVSLERRLKDAEKRADAATNCATAEAREEASEVHAGRLAREVRDLKQEMAEASERADKRRRGDADRIRGLIESSDGLRRQLVEAEEEVRRLTDRLGAVEGCESAGGVAGEALLEVVAHALANAAGDIRLSDVECWPGTVPAALARAAGAIRTHVKHLQSKPQDGQAGDV